MAAMLYIYTTENLHGDGMVSFSKQTKKNLNKLYPIQTQISSF